MQFEGFRVRTTKEDRVRRKTDLQTWLLRRLFDRLFNLIVGRSLLETDDEVDDGHVARRNTERHTGEFTIQAGNDLADGLGRTSGRRNNVSSSTTPTAPVLCGRAVDGLLGGGRGVHGRHQTFDDAEPIVDDLGERRKAVCRARGVGDDVDIRGIFFFIDAQNKHGCIGRGSTDDDLLCAALDVCRGLFFCGEDTLDKERVYQYQSIRNKAERRTGSIESQVGLTVDSTTYSTPSRPQGMFEGSLSAKTQIALPLITSLPSLVSTVPLKRPWVESYLNMYAYMWKKRVT